MVGHRWSTHLCNRSVASRYGFRSTRLETAHSTRTYGRRGRTIYPPSHDSPAIADLDPCHPGCLCDHVNSISHVDDTARHNWLLASTSSRDIRLFYQTLRRMAHDARLADLAMDLGNLARG
jgi:hypothetical protein